MFVSWNAVSGKYVLGPINTRKQPVVLRMYYGYRTPRRGLRQRNTTDDICTKDHLWKPSTSHLLLSRCSTQVNAMLGRNLQTISSLELLSLERLLVSRTLPIAADKIFIKTLAAIGASTPFGSDSSVTGLAIRSSWHGVATFLIGLASLPASWTYRSTHDCKKGFISYNMTVTGLVIHGWSSKSWSKYEKPCALAFFLASPLSLLIDASAALGSAQPFVKR